MTRLRAATIRPIYDSRGRPTVEVTLSDESGLTATAGAPSGTSTGVHEVLAFPSGGVPGAVERFRAEVGPRLLGRDVNDQVGIDLLLREIDGTPKFSRIGGNVATATSVALLSLRAQVGRKPIWATMDSTGPTPPRFPNIVGNCLNGGRHAIGGPEFQEFIAYSTAFQPADAVRGAISVHAAIGKALEKRYPGLALGRGDEGGWVAPLTSVEALDVLASACHEVSDREHLPVAPGLDLAASEFFRDGSYVYRDRRRSPEEQVSFVGELVDRYGIRYIEDPMEQEDFDGFANLTRSVGRRSLVVGDDLYTTDQERVAEGIHRHSTNAVLVKVNQVGTVTNATAAVERAKRAGWETVTSHRSGDLPEGWLAHIALGFRSIGIKCGVLGGERVAKLNELLRLAAALGVSA